MFPGEVFDKRQPARVRCAWPDLCNLGDAFLRHEWMQALDVDRGERSIRDGLFMSGHRSSSRAVTYVDNARLRQSLECERREYDLCCSQHTPTAGCGPADLVFWGCAAIGAVGLGRLPTLATERSCKDGAATVVAERAGERLRWATRRRSRVREPQRC